MSTILPLKNRRWVIATGVKQLVFGAHCLPIETAKRVAVHWNRKDPEKGPVVEVILGVRGGCPNYYLTYMMRMQTQEKTHALAAELLRRTRAVLDIP